MSIIVSTHKNSIIVVEKIESVHKEFYPGSRRPTRALTIHYDSGFSSTLTCKTIKERDELFDNIVNAMTHTNYGK